MIYQIDVLTVEFYFYYYYLKKYILGGVNVICLP